MAVSYLLAAITNLPEKIWVCIPTKTLFMELTDASPRGISHMITSHYDLRESVRRHLASIRQKNIALAGAHAFGRHFSHRGSANSCPG